MKTLALDCSTKRTGWAVYDDDNNLQYGAIAISSNDVEKRITHMRDEIKKLLEKYQPDNIIMEEIIQDNYNNRTSKVLSWLQGVIDIMVYEYNKDIKIEFIGASSWRSKLGLQGKAIRRDEQKEIDIAYANKHYNLALAGTQDDEADALCLLAYAQGAEKGNLKELKPKKSKEEFAF